MARRGEIGGTAVITVGANTGPALKEVNAAANRIQRMRVDFGAKGAQPLGKISGNVTELNKSLDAANARVVAFGASAGSIYLVNRAIKSLVTTTIQVQKELSNINVLLNLSSSGLKTFSSDLFAVARNTSQAFSTAASAAQEFSRQGLSMEETLKRTNAALVLTRVSGMDAVKSVQALTSTVNAFISTAITAEEVVNKLANVDANFAVSSADLANALQRVGSSAQDAGVSFDQLLAIVTTAQQVTARGGSVIGNSFKTIFTRLQRQKTVNLLEGLGIETKNSSGELKGTIDLLKSLTSVYDRVGTVQKSYIAEQVGGVFQINILKAALNDLGKEFSIYDRALHTSMNTTDQATRRNEEMNKTLAALSQQAATNVQQAASSIGNMTLDTPMKSVLVAFNSVFDRINELDSDGVGAKLGTGLIKGLGNFISGPGVLLVGGIAANLFKKFSQFAAGSFKELLGLNSVVKERHGLQSAILNILSREEDMNNRLLRGQMSQQEAGERIKLILNDQYTLLKRQEASSLAIARNLQKAGFSINAVSMGGNVIPAAASIKTKASGFVPQFAEKMGAREHGYAPGRVFQTRIHDGTGKSEKSYVNSAEKIINFRNNDGKKATMVVPPNGFGAGTQYASSGFVPNFANSIGKYFYDPEQQLGGDPRLLKAFKSLSGLSGSKGEYYRGGSTAEVNKIMMQGFAVSLGKGNTRKGAKGSYVASDLGLAARFALTAQRDKKSGSLMFLDGSKLGPLQSADEGNFIAKNGISKAAVKRVLPVSSLMSSGFMPNFSQIGGGRNGFQVKWMLSEIKRKGLPMEAVNDPNIIGRLAKIFAKKYPNNQGMFGLSSGFVPNFASVEKIAAISPRVRQRLNLSYSDKGDQRLNPTDLINLKGNKFKQEIVPLKKNETMGKYESRVAGAANYTLSNSTLKFKSSSAIDGFKISENGNKTDIDLLEVKGGKNWDGSSVLNKFLRALPENYFEKGNPLDIFNRGHDDIRVGGTLITPFEKNTSATQQKSLRKKGKASGFVPNFAKPKVRHIDGGRSTMGRAETLTRDYSSKYAVLTPGGSSPFVNMMAPISQIPQFAGKKLTKDYAVKLRIARGSAKFKNFEGVAEQAVTPAIDSLARHFAGSPVQSRGINISKGQRANFFGQVFEAALNTAFSAKNIEEGGIMDLPSIPDPVAKLFGVKPGIQGDYKRSGAGISASKSMIKKVAANEPAFMKDLKLFAGRAEKGRDAKKMGKASGFLPNFASSSLIGEIQKRVTNSNINTKLSEGSGLTNESYLKAAGKLGVNTSGLESFLAQSGFPLRGKAKIAGLSRALGKSFGRSFNIDALKMGDWKYLEKEFVANGLTKDDFDKVSRFSKTEKGASALKWGFNSNKYKSSGFIPNFAKSDNYLKGVKNLEAGMSGSKATFHSDPFPHFRNKSQPTFASAMKDHGGLKNAISDSAAGQRSAGLLPKSAGFVPNFSDTPEGPKDQGIDIAAVIGGLQMVAFSLMFMSGQTDKAAEELKNLDLKDVDKQVSDLDKSMAEYNKVISDASAKLESPSEFEPVSEEKSSGMFLKEKQKIADDESRAASLKGVAPESFAIAEEDLKNSREALADSITRENAKRAEGAKSLAAKREKANIDKGAASTARQALVEQKKQAMEARKWGTKATALLKNKGFQIGAMAQVVSAQIAEFIPKDTNKGRAASSAVSGIGNVAGIAGTAAMMSGGNPYVVGAAAAGASFLELDKAVKALTTKVPDLQKGIEETQKTINDMTAAGQSYLTASENYSNELKKADSSTQNLQRFQKEVNQALMNIPPAYKAQMLSAIKLGTAQEAYAKILEEETKRLKEKEAAKEMTQVAEEGKGFLKSLGGAFSLLASMPLAFANFGLNLSETGSASSAGSEAASGVQSQIEYMREGAPLTKEGIETVAGALAKSFTNRSVDVSNLKTIEESRLRNKEVLDFFSQDIGILSDRGDVGSKKEAREKISLKMKDFGYSQEEIQGFLDATANVDTLDEVIFEFRKKIVESSQALAQTREAVEAQIKEIENAQAVNFVNKMFEGAAEKFKAQIEVFSTRLSSSNKFITDFNQALNDASARKAGRQIENSKALGQGFYDSKKVSEDMYESEVASRLRPGDSMEAFDNKKQRAVDDYNFAKNQREVETGAKNDVASLVAAAKERLAVDSATRGVNTETGINVAKAVAEAIVPIFTTNAGAILDGDGEATVMSTALPEITRAQEIINLKEGVQSLTDGISSMTASGASTEDIIAVAKSEIDKMNQVYGGDNPAFTKLSEALEGIKSAANDTEKQAAFEAFNETLISAISNDENNEILKESNAIAKRQLGVQLAQLSLEAKMAQITQDLNYAGGWQSTMDPTQSPVLQELNEALNKFKVSGVDRERINNGEASSEELIASVNMIDGARKAGVEDLIPSEFRSELEAPVMEQIKQNLLNVMKPINDAMEDRGYSGMSDEEMNERAGRRAEYQAKEALGTGATGMQRVRDELIEGLTSKISENKNKKAELVDKLETAKTPQEQLEITKELQELIAVIERQETEVTGYEDMRDPLITSIDEFKDVTIKAIEVLRKEIGTLRDSKTEAPTGGSENERLSKMLGSTLNSSPLREGVTLDFAKSLPVDLNLSDTGAFVEDLKEMIKTSVEDAVQVLRNGEQPTPPPRRTKSKRNGL